MNITLNSKIALALCGVAAPKKEWREVLKSVHIEKNGDTLIYVATDSFTLCKFEQQTAENVEDFSVNIPAETIKTFLKKSDKEVQLTIEEGCCTLKKLGGITLGFNQPEGKYPDYKNCLKRDKPRGEEGGEVYINPQLLEKVSKAYREGINDKNEPLQLSIIGSMSPIKFFNQAKDGITFEGALMPFRK